MGTALLLLVAAGLLAAFWLDSARAREFAIQIATALCRRRGLQFLDDTVVLRRIGVRWGGKGLRFRRMFDFDFSLGGTGRRAGFVIMVGTEIEQYGLDLPLEDPTGQAPAPEPLADKEGDKVVPFRRPRQK